MTIQIFQYKHTKLRRKDTLYFKISLKTLCFIHLFFLQLQINLTFVYVIHEVNWIWTATCKVGTIVGFQTNTLFIQKQAHACNKYINLIVTCNAYVVHHIKRIIYIVILYYYYFFINLMILCSSKILHLTKRKILQIHIINNLIIHNILL